MNLKIGRGIHTCSNVSPGKAQLNGSKLSNSATTFSSTSAPAKSRKSRYCFLKVILSIEHSASKIGNEQSSNYRNDQVARRSKYFQCPTFPATKPNEHQAEVAAK